VGRTERIAGRALQMVLALVLATVIGCQGPPEPPAEGGRGPDGLARRAAPEVAGYVHLS